MTWILSVQSWSGGWHSQRPRPWGADWWWSAVRTPGNTRLSLVNPLNTRLWLVARTRALTGEDWDLLQVEAITGTQWCILERVGRARHHGEVTQGRLSLQVILSSHWSLLLALASYWSIFSTLNSRPWRLTQRRCSITESLWSRTASLWSRFIMKSPKVQGWWGERQESGGQWRLQPEYPHSWPVRMSAGQKHDVASIPEGV